MNYQVHKKRAAKKNGKVKSKARKQSHDGTNTGRQRRGPQVESKIKNEINYYKNMQRNLPNEPIFDKEPQMFFRVSEDHPDYDRNIDTNYQRGADVALRRKSSHSNSPIKMRPDRS